MLKDNNAALSEVLAEQRDQSESLAREARALAREQEALGEASRSATERDSDQENALREALLDQIRENQDRLAEAAQEAQEADAEPPSGLPNDLARRREALARQIEAVENGALQEALS